VLLGGFGLVVWHAGAGTGGPIIEGEPPPTVGIAGALEDKRVMLTLAGTILAGGGMILGAVKRMNEE
jgi:hypothetical protein